MVHLVDAAAAAADDADDSNIDCGVFAMALVATMTLTTMTMNLWHLSDMNKCSLNTVVMYNYVMALVWLHMKSRERKVKEAKICIIVCIFETKHKSTQNQTKTNRNESRDLS